jgi:hypothetical protein
VFLKKECWRRLNLDNLGVRRQQAVGKSRLLHVELPSWKILLLGPLVYRGDYQTIQRLKLLVQDFQLPDRFGIEELISKFLVVPPFVLARRNRANGIGNQSTFDTAVENEHSVQL